MVLCLGENVSNQEGRKINIAQAPVSPGPWLSYIYNSVFSVLCKIDAFSLLPAEEAVVQYRQAVGSRPHSKPGRSQDLNSRLISKPSLVMQQTPTCYGSGHLEGSVLLCAMKKKKLVDEF